LEFFGGGRELLGSPNLLSIRPKNVVEPSCFAPFD